MKRWGVESWQWGAQTTPGFNSELLTPNSQLPTLPMTNAKQYCCFAVADCWFGVDVQVVQEVIRYQEMTRVPLAPAEVTGLINLRGQIVTAIDLRRRLDLPARPAGQLPMNVVIRTADSDAAVSLLVDEIGDVIQPDADTYEPQPALLTGPTRELVAGVHKLKGRLLLVLNTAAAVSLGGPLAAAA